MSEPDSKALIHPRYWPAWASMGLMRLSVLMPLPMLQATGRLLGRIACRTLSRRRRIAERNIARCFPELDGPTQAALVRQTFEAAGMGLLETALTWWGSDRRFRNIAAIDGLEHLDAAREKGKGVILLSCHFTCLEICLRALLSERPFHPMYRAHENPVIERFMRRSRTRLSENPIPKDDVRALIRSLKAKKVVWYAPDQAYRGKMSAMVPFFGHDAATNLATSRIAAMTGAPVVPLFFRRSDGLQPFRIELMPPLDNFPGDDPAADAERINRVFEDAIRETPGQYLWIHRRFKSLDDGVSFYE